MPLSACGCLTEMSRNAIQGAMNDVRAGMANTQSSSDADPFSHESLMEGLP
jgi:hypothetical protein